MWITEEKAISFFESTVWQQIREIQTNPKDDTLKIKTEIFQEFIKILYTNTPQPPNFNKIAAKNIEPTTGASTCALGSHIWAPDIGSLMRKAKAGRNITSIILYLLWSITIKNLVTFLVMWTIIKNSKGIEPKAV